MVSASNKHLFPHEKLLGPMLLFTEHFIGSFLYGSGSNDHMIPYYYSHAAEMMDGKPSSSGLRIIFLDVDGVLCNSRSLLLEFDDEDTSLIHDLFNLFFMSAIIIAMDITVF